MSPFHIAIPVENLEETREFYSGMLGCKTGRSSEKWLDFDFFGHQLSTHLKPEECALARTNEVDGKNVPVRHFGIILDWIDWENLAAELKRKNANFMIEPYVRFKEITGEQGTFFIKDPSGNALEFKSFKDIANLFRVA